MKIVHIIKRGNNWAAHKPKSSRAICTNKHRDIVFHKAAITADLVITHNSDGSVDFVFEKCSSQ